MPTTLQSAAMGVSWRRYKLFPARNDVNPLLLSVKLLVMVLHGLGGLHHLTSRSLVSSSNVRKTLGSGQVLDVVLNIVKGQTFGLGKRKSGEERHEHDTRAKTNGTVETGVGTEVAKGKGGEERTTLAGSGRDSVSGYLELG